MATTMSPATITDDELRARTEALVAEHADVLDDQVAFRGAQFDAGLAMVQFPVGRGGLGLSPGKQAVVNEVLRAHGVRYDDLRINPIGIGMAAPTLLTYASDDVVDAHLRRIFTGEDVWCQLFSEPTNGSDVAGIPSRAVRDGDEWVVNGQKVWTTLAHISRYGLLLTRTDPDVPKHRGLSYFILDMQAPGVEIRPLFQITGEAEFNEVFLTDVRVPDRMRLGGEGDGWRVATTTLMNERVALSGSPTPRGGGAVSDLVKCWAERADRLTPAERAVMRDRVAGLWVRAEVLRLTNQRAKDSARSGNPGPEGSVGKLESAQLSQAIHRCIVDLLGPEGTLHELGYPMTRSAEAPDSRTGRFLRSRANTIEGGTSEIMRNILGERVLGLPGDVRVDKDLPWSQIPR
jgi:alkylation response protein AidB-like acyl-CoA dehydrogenase